VPAGVFVTGTAHHIALRGLEVHDIRTATADAHGIAVYGTSGDAAIHDVTIERNSVHDNHLGSSESVVVNGNVRDWSIARNRIFRNDNIGVDAIGFDYVDGGRDLLIERNVVLRSNIALEIASEHSFGSATNVLAPRQRARRSTTIGLAMGRYDTERGQTIDARVVNNTFVNNATLGTGSGEILLQYRVYDSQILNNIVVANARAIMIANPYVEKAGNVVDGNAWWVVGAPPPTATWQWKNVTYHGFASYRRATGNDAHSVLGDPLLGPGWRPRPASPAIDAGLDTPLAGAFDVYGGPRRQGRAIDIGAVERTPA
jgi:hypothetical protein